MVCGKYRPIIGGIAICIGLLLLVAHRDENPKAPISEPEPEQIKGAPYDTPDIRATLEDRDIIYRKRKDKRNYIPVVNEEYKTIFFFIGKCASSEWKRMFARMIENPHWCSNWIHKKEVNRLTWLNDYPKEEAENMMTSPDWTRAIFVRNPKDRTLSAFLDKAVAHSSHFVERNCGAYERRGYDRQACIDHHLEFDFFLRNMTTAVPNNVHWTPIYEQIEEKWWPYINYVGYMEHLNKDAETFLRTIVSDKDGVSAWERWGKTGWSGNEDNCTAVDRTNAFLSRQDSSHETDAHTKLRKYFNPATEIFAENRYYDDLNNPYFQFTPVELFPHNSPASRGEGTS